MQILGVETTGRLGGFAVVGDNGVLSEILTDMQAAHVEKGSDLIRDALGMASVKIGDIDGVAVSIGPGSFTGLRVGLAIGKGLCFACGAKLIAVPTLDAIAEMLKIWQGIAVAMRDARRGEVYFSIYRCENTRVERLSDYQALPPSEALDIILDLAGDESIVVSGDAVQAYGKLLRDKLPAETVFAPPDLWLPRPAVVAAIGRERLQAGKWIDLDKAEPLYIRPSEAERKLQRRGRWQGSKSE